jgi:hypothetical protein
MQSRFLNTRIESSLTLAVAALSVAVIAAGTLGMGRSFEPAPHAVAEVAPLERVVITSKRAPAKLAQASANAQTALN